MYNVYWIYFEFNWFQLVQIKLEKFFFLIKIIRLNIFRCKNIQNSNFLKNIHT